GAAVVIHAAILLFGGIFFMHSDEDPKKTKIENVELIQTQDEARKKDKEKKPAEEEAKKEEEKAEKEEIKDHEDVPDLKELEKLDAAAAAPALDAMSLSALESALNPGEMSGADGFLQSSVDFASGGRIGGTGRGAAGDEGADGGAFTIAELDQKPRAIVQTAPQ